MAFTSRALVVAVAAATVACGASATSTPRIRVARDLGCTAEMTSVQRLSEHRWQVTGCGRTATYVCTYPVRDCWREGPIHAIETAGVEAEGPQGPIVTGR